MDWEIRRYSPEDAAQWNDFIAHSRNATFLHNRGFMDYHSDRFRDHSLVATLRGRLSAVLPSNDETADNGRKRLVSHRGLTYGGWIFPRARVDAGEVLGLFECLVGYMRAEGFGELVYKPVPHIYTATPAQEDEYALWRLGAVQSCVNISAACRIDGEPELDRLRRRQLKKAESYIRENGLEIREFDDSGKLVRLIESCLDERYGARPVHNAAELALLKSRFPDNIHYFGIFEGERLQAGTCIFDTGTVAHVQYNSSTPLARETGILTTLVVNVMERFKDRRWFDFGTSNEDHGRVLNESLFQYKASYGCRGVLYPEYTLEL